MLWLLSELACSCGDETAVEYQMLREWCTWGLGREGFLWEWEPQGPSFCPTAQPAVPLVGWEGSVTTHSSLEPREWFLNRKPWRSRRGENALFGLR